ncbi:hypothetical protein EWE75_23755 [Sphingomonas populi]|uniref:Uncharacterized protein n=1 Tax=Sphingomonas populi TaxID=2484750 RepID=A0A4Q6XHJ8_9SPHN|nr:hypothetical protein [Sphingomonas populi]RZF59073.1 hypothetical protein EWE75_23755 [Sphingomonas populi]
MTAPRLMIAAALLSGSFDAAAQTPASAPIPASAPHWVKGTPVRLMVLNEINSRQARAGERFKLRVDAPVMIDNVVVIPVGATAWGEVIAAHGTSAAGGRGRLSARLLFVDTPSGRVELSGTLGQEGKSNSSGVVLGLIGFGLPGLLTKGGNATFKAGDILIGYIEQGDTPLSAPLLVTPG